MALLLLLLTLLQRPDHVGKPIPEFMHGDECLFCHRNAVGMTWQKNSHGITLRQREDAPALAKLLESQPAWGPQVEYTLGSRKHIRFLKKEGYGKLSLLSAKASLGPLEWIHAENPTWDKDRFADRCVGCHATAVDPVKKTFTAFGLDCYTCHGDTPLEHTTDISQAWLSKKRKDDALAVTSICAQCHLRGGKSRSTGLPYPNNFVAGDNLFLDYQADLSKADDKNLNPGDRHVLRNVRDIVERGQKTPTCLNCHRVHDLSRVRHWLPKSGPLCFDCHSTEGKYTPGYTVHSELCEY